MVWNKLIFMPKGLGNISHNKTVPSFGHVTHGTSDLKLKSYKKIYSFKTFVRRIVLKICSEHDNDSDLTSER